MFLLIRSTHKKQEAQMCQKGCCLFLIFSEPIEPNLVRMFIGWFHEKLVIFIDQKYTKETRSRNYGHNFNGLYENRKGQSEEIYI
jgi:hypothetical protein